MRPGGEEGEEMPHHRFVATFEVTMVEPGTTDTSPAEPAPPDLGQDLGKEIKKTKPKKSGIAYDVEQVKRIS